MIEPGLHAGMSFNDYAALPAVNHSSLRHIKRSPAHYVAAKTKAREESEAQRLGTMIHTYVLEQDAWSDRYILTPDLTVGILDKNGRPYTRPTATSEYKLRLANWQRVIGSRREVSEDELAMCDGIATAIRTHPAAGPILDMAYHAELVVVWQDPVTGIDCKARLDLRTDDGSIVLDLKSAADASEAGFARSVPDYGYHTAAAWYLWGLSCVGAPANRFLHLAVEKEEPYAVGVYELDDAAIEKGLAETRAWIDTLARCREQNHWPAYSDDVVGISLPKWATSNT